MDDIQKAARVKAFRLMQWAGAGSTLLIAAGLYVYFPDRGLAPIIGGILAVVGLGEFFVFRALADEVEQR